MHAAATAPTVAPTGPLTGTASEPFLGESLVLVLGLPRSGTTLLRKILDTHPAIHSPAETWFLLPLLDLWYGDGRHDRFNPRQAAAALQGHVDRAGFLRCCRGFAQGVYTRRPAGAELYVDKTPLYLAIADELVEVFPRARFLLLGRDPRAIAWSRATWRHATDANPRRYIDSIVRDVRRLADFGRRHGERSHLVSYERLCREPADEARRVVEFLGLDFDPAMLEYGAIGHHEGYGDENAGAHRAAHTDSIDRWRGRVPEPVQRDLIGGCGEEALAVLDLAGLEIAPGPTEAPPAPAPGGPASASGGSSPRVLFFQHTGRNTRDILLDMARGFEQSGCSLVRCEITPLMEMFAGRQADPAHALTDSARIVKAMIESNGIDLSVGMWGNALGCVAHGAQDGRVRSFFDLVESPHLMFWLDAPHWSDFHDHFGTPLIDSRWCFNLVNNEPIGLEMASVLGFTNVLARPYGVDADRFHPLPVEPDFDLVFAVGAGVAEPTPLMLRELESDEPDVDAIRREAAADVRQSLTAIETQFDGAAREAVHAVLDRLVDMQVEAPHRPMLERVGEIAGEEPWRRGCGLLLGRPALWAEAGQIIRRVEAWRRAFLVTYLARRFGCAVFGGGTLDGWDCRAERLGFVEYDEQSRCYARGRVGLNVMRWQDDVGLNLKPFEISACGVPCLCERRVGVDDSFVPDREITVFDDPADAARRLRGLLDDPATRQAVGAAARARVERDHTWRVRAGQLLPAIGAATSRWS